MAFDLFSRPTGILGDQFDHRRRGIGIGDDIEGMKGVEPAEQEEKAQDADHDPLDQRKFNDSGYHGVRLDSNSKEENRRVGALSFDFLSLDQDRAFRHDTLSRCQAFQDPHLIR